MSAFTLLILQMLREMCQYKCAFISHSSVMKIYLPFSFFCTLPASTCRYRIKLLNKKFSFSSVPIFYLFSSPGILSLQSANNNSLEHLLLPLSNPISSVVLHTVSTERTVQQNETSWCSTLENKVFFGVFFLIQQILLTLNFTCYNNKQYR